MLAFTDISTLEKRMEHAFAEDVHAAKTVGMNEHIAKPLDLNTLAKILKKWISNGIS